MCVIKAFVSIHMNAECFLTEARAAQGCDLQLSQRRAAPSVGRSSTASGSSTCSDREQRLSLSSRKESMDPHPEPDPPQLKDRTRTKSEHWSPPRNPINLINQLWKRALLCGLSTSKLETDWRAQTEYLTFLSDFRSWLRNTSPIPKVPNQTGPNRPIRTWTASLTPSVPPLLLSSPPPLHRVAHVPARELTAARHRNRSTARGSAREEQLCCVQVRRGNPRKCEKLFYVWVTWVDTYRVTWCSWIFKTLWKQTRRHHQTTTIKTKDLTRNCLFLFTNRCYECFSAWWH